MKKSELIRLIETIAKQIISEDDNDRFWVAYDIAKDEYLAIPEKELNKYPNVTWTSGVSNRVVTKREVDKHNAAHKKRFIKPGKTYNVSGYDYKGKKIAKIEKIDIKNKTVYVKFYNDPKEYNYAHLKFSEV